MVHLELLYRPTAATKSSKGKRLVVVSNRVPLPSVSSTPAAGGLAIALEAALKKRGGLWFGWSGKVGEKSDPAPEIHGSGAIDYAICDLSRRDLDEFYHGFANRVLWPICHYRLDLASLSQRDAAGYFRVNEQFARRLAALLRRDDVIWVHDYHFIPMASFLRQLGCPNRMGFFSHIPWPAPEIASALPALGRILRSFSAYDVIGFQTRVDAGNFRDTLVAAKVGSVAGAGLCRAYGRTFAVDAFPIGIDAASFAREAKLAEKNATVRRMRESLGDRPLMIGVDRLDYSKGIGQRIESVAALLERSPQSVRSRATLLQITPRSRSEVPEYARLHREIAELVGTVNGKWGDIDWTPIRYINKTMSQATLAGLYRLARVGVVTPLRDGMNLVAKEYVAAQSPEDPGVLVLSQFAGAAQELEAALVVNPYDVEATAAALARALAMGLEERKERWQAMMAALKANSIDHWTRRYLQALGYEPFPAEASGDALGVPPPLESESHAAPVSWRAPGAMPPSYRH